MITCATWTPRGPSSRAMLCATARNPSRGAAYEEPSEAADPPTALEVFRRGIDHVAALERARVEHRDRELAVVGAAREQCVDVSGVGRVAAHRHGTSRAPRKAELLQRGAARGGENRVSLRDEPVHECEPESWPDADDHRSLGRAGALVSNRIDHGLLLHSSLSR